MKNFTVIDAPQRSPEWFQARVGRLTSSRASDAVAPSKRGTAELKARKDYRLQLVAERLTGLPQCKEFYSVDTARGVELEPAAIAAYEAHTGAWVDRVGFVAHNELMAGGSPDGIVGDFEGIVEIKSTRPVVHLGYMDGFWIPADYQLQCVHLLWLTGAEWLDFVSYCPQMPPSMQLHVVRMDRSALPGYDEKARAFLEEVDLAVRARTPIGVALANSLKETA